MSGHTGAVFNHSCLKVPINPINKLPAPTYEQKYVNQLQNQALKHLNSPTPSDNEKSATKQPKTMKSLIDFYDSIPDYSDINHLSNQDFYRKIENLKAKQKSYYEYLDAEYSIDSKADHFVDDYKKQGERSSSRKSDNSKSNYHKRETPETDSVLSFGKDVLNPPSRRSVRIESPKSVISELVKTHRNVSSAGSKDSNKSIYSTIENIWDDLDFKDYQNDLERNSRSLPSSPVKSKQSVGFKDCGITIPKPFQMTVRDEEDQIVSEILEKNVKPPKEDKPEMFRAHPVPIESQIPLFDHIMEEQEIRRQIVKLRSKEKLQSRMRPFSFTKREEEIQALTRRFSKSSPQLCPQYPISFDEPELKIKPFKAKPVPKNLFSNYIYRKMHEDEFYRALKKKIRAEEMLKRASLPPSMARREKTHVRHGICPRSVRDYVIEDKEEDKKSLRMSDYSSRHEQLDLQLEDLKNDFITTTPRPFRFQTAKRHEKKRARSVLNKDLKKEIVIWILAEPA